MPDEKSRPSVADLEHLIESGQAETIEIMPDGSIRQTGIVPTPKPLTLRKDLGDNYVMCDNDWPSQDHPRCQQIANRILDELQGNVITDDAKD